jgi:hypothetical protein
MALRHAYDIMQGKMQSYTLKNLHYVKQWRKRQEGNMFKCYGIHFYSDGCLLVYFQSFFCIFLIAYNKYIKIL